MKEIHPNLFIGDQQDYKGKVQGREDWKVVQACKEPYHRNALGYSTHGAPKNDPEYLIVRRGNRLILNLVDADNPDYIPKKIIDAALKFIDKNLKNEEKVLVHCNKGRSRSPSIGLLYLAINNQIANSSFKVAKEDFISIYPNYNPNLGIEKFLIRNWNEYCK